MKSHIKRYSIRNVDTHCCREKECTSSCDVSGRTRPPNAAWTPEYNWSHQENTRYRDAIAESLLECPTSGCNGNWQHWNFRVGIQHRALGNNI